MGPVDRRGQRFPRGCHGGPLRGVTPGGWRRQDGGGHRRARPQGAPRQRAAQGHSRDDEAGSAFETLAARQ